MVLCNIHVILSYPIDFVCNFIKIWQQNSSVTQVSPLSTSHSTAFRCITLYTCSTKQKTSLSLSSCSHELLSSACRRSSLQFFSSMTHINKKLGITFCCQALKSSFFHPSIWWTTSIFAVTTTGLPCHIMYCGIIHCSGKESIHKIIEHKNFKCFLGKNCNELKNSLSHSRLRHKSKQSSVTSVRWQCIYRQHNWISISWTWQLTLLTLIQLFCFWKDSTVSKCLL